MTDMRIMSELLFDEAAFQSTHDFVLAFSNHALPILVDSSDNVAIHIAAETFADDVERVTGTRPKVYKDELPKDAGGKAIIAATAGSRLLRSVQHAGVEDVRGKWECYDARLVQAPCKGVDQGLVIMGSDRRGVIFGLYTLSELMGVSPWYWWADVAVSRRSTVAFPRHLVLAHGEPTVKYRGFFLNDEQPVLWNWAKEHFKIPKGQPPFQVGMYEKVFELVLRLKGNYLWPAMWASMFAVDGQDVSSGLPSTPTPGPNQALADRMGVVMGTSHHEPMSRNQKEYTTWGQGDWNFETNEKWLTEFWKYGAERAKGLETLYTVGMRGDGDLPLDGANVPLLERITSVQQDILREVHDKKDLSDIPQLWAIYKEVMGYFASGLKVPEEVTALLADDNWGNLQAVMPTDRDHAGGGGIYYHADYVGDPRDYKWTNTVSLAKMWEQLNIARSFKTDRIWICNVGDLKVLETPLELFMSLAYDFDAIPRDGLKEYLAKKSKRDYGNGMEDEVADIMATYSIYASRRKAELVDSHTYSITTFDEAERVLKQWADLEERATRVYKQLPAERKSAFYQVVYSAILLNHNLNRLYISAAKSNLYATQGRAAANFHAQTALDCFERDWELTQEYHALEGGKWKHVLNQPHINYQYWQMPVRNSMPPISFISKHEPTYANEYVIHTRYTVEGSRGAWPGDNKFNCPLGYNCPDPTLAVMDRYGRPRWIEVGSGGPEDIEFTAEPVEEWMMVHPSKGKIKAGGADDVRVWISVDWDKVDPNAKAGHVRLNSSDCAKTTVITLPLEHVQAPPHGFVGALQGDGYVAIEAAHCQELVSADKHSWAEVAHYGRTHSGMSLFPVSDVSFVSGKGPCMAYNVWITSLPSDTVTAILHIGPSLNFILGQRISFAVQMDDGDIKVVEPVPEAKLGDLPGDWEDIVAAEVREVRVNVMVKGTGKHVFKVWAITPGVVVERIMLDLGGIASREATYLGPPESIIL